MTIMRRSRHTPALAAALLLCAMPSCDSENPLSAVCCTEFKVGADLSTADFGLQGEVRGRFVAFAQASADLAATASAALVEVETACRNVAVELGVPAADIAAAERRPERDRTTELCRLAIAQIKEKVTARVQVDVLYDPPACEVSVQAQARCEGQCSATGTCDVKANPPVCRGGRLEIVCKGECTAKAGATLHCEGTCTGNCQGACTAEGGVRCNGKCEGTCTAGGGGGGGGGAKADAFDAQGNCVGICRGTCSSTPPGVQCQGSCNGQCDAACRAEANATVTCDGTCAGEYEPLRCEGGTLESTCDVDAKCKANCEASASARAECRPPTVVVTARAAADPEIGRYLQVLEANIAPLLVMLKARGQTFIDIVGEVAGAAGATGSAAVSGELNARASACLVPIATTIGEAAANARVSVQASTDVLAAVGVR